MRMIRFREEKSGLSARFSLLDEAAPRSAAFLWELARHKPSFDAIHAIWTGPEISCPMPAASLPADMASQTLAEENATSYPDAGELALAFLAAGAVKGLPPGNFFDIGLFYGPGGRLLMPFGWIRANVCARVVPDDFENLVEGCKAIRRNGACTLAIETV